ncbi:MAG TPA: hypothetical protein VJ044_06470 [Candidatus Hodarchaeales archaeon]|nr:hypothetical protein [Candidatus Hodarchaeales archaeon]
MKRSSRSKEGLTVRDSISQGAGVPVSVNATPTTILTLTRNIPHNKVILYFIVAEIWYTGTFDSTLSLQFSRDGQSSSTRGGPYRITMPQVNSVANGLNRATMTMALSERQTDSGASSVLLLQAFHDGTPLANEMRIDTRTLQVCF